MCDSSNEKQGEKLFLLWRHSALLVRPFSWLAKNRRQGIPVSTLETGRYATVRFAAPSSSHLHFEALLSLLGSSRKPLITKFTPAVSSVYSLSLSLSLSLSAWAHSKKKISPGSAQLIQAKVRKAPVPSLFFLLWTSRSTCEFELRAGRGQHRCHDCRIENRTSGFQRWLTCSRRHRWMLPPGLQSSYSWQWLIQKKKKFRAFSGDPANGAAAFWPTTWLLNGGNFCRVRITGSNIFRCKQATNK